MQAKYAELSPGKYLEQPVAWTDSMSQGNNPKIFFLTTGHFFMIFGQGRAHDHNLDNLGKRQRGQSVCVCCMCAVCLCVCVCPGREVSSEDKEGNVLFIQNSEPTCPDLLPGAVITQERM